MLHKLFIINCTNSTWIMNPFTFIKDSYNHEAPLEARKLKKLDIQLAKSRIARMFNLRCLANKVTPKTLQIKWKGKKFEQAIIKKAECSLIHNRIKCTNIKINHLQTEIANTKTFLQQKLDELTFANLQNTIFNNRENISTVQEHPDQEVQAPYIQSLQNNFQEGTNTWRNTFTTERPKMCSYPSNHPHQRIHHYYCGSSPDRWMQWFDCSGLYHNVSRILNKYTNKAMHTNITKSDHLALENLRKDKDHIIVTADKGVALVVRDKTEYITKCEALLQDNSVSQHLSKDTSSTIHKELIKILQDYKNNNFISETEYTLLRPYGSNSPAARFYCLPKIHKNNMPMCPIVSVYGTATYNTAKFISKILQNYCGKTSSSVKDSTDFIKKIKHLSVKPEEESLVSFDVSATFTSIPVPVALQVINSKISTCTNFSNVYKIPTEKFIKLEEFTLTNCIFCFNKKFYKQLQGAAMGSPVSPIIANIYMEQCESLAIHTCPTLIKWWLKYVDDVYSATGKDQVNKLQEHLNFIDPHIKFTIELPGTEGLPFLYTLTKPTPNSIESTMYRKLTHTDRYLDYSSNHPISAKLSVIHTLIQELNKYVPHMNFLQKKWITFTKSCKTTTTQYSSFNKANPNKKPMESQTHVQ